MGSGRAEEILAVHEALEHLAELDARQAQVVEMRFFVGLGVEETAKVLKVSPQSVMRDWKLAKAWLRREIRKSRCTVP
jgi:RNA polymerase sigma factor (sigma-70 family)